MNVLSLFDGMGCAWIALKELGLNVDRGYSSEIDKHAVHQVEVNFPEVERLGSVTDVDVSKLERIDLLTGGSPCQSFSFAGKRKGMATTENEEIYTLERYLELKRQGFRFEGQSYLFWEYMRILEDIRKYNPDVLFLLENVEMGSKWERVLNEAIGIRGVHINSALVSAQNRKRIYWTNIRVRHDGLFGEAYSDIPQPEDRGILLKEILEEEVDEKYYLSDGMMSFLKRHSEKMNIPIKVLYGDEKTYCISASDVKMNLQTNYVCAAMRGRDNAMRGHEAACLTTKRNDYGKAIRKDYEEGRVKEQRKNIQQLEPRIDGKTNALTTVTKDNLVVDGGDLFCVSSNQAHATVSVNKSTPFGGGHVPMVGECKQRIGGVSITERGIRFHRGDERKSGVSELGTVVFPESKANTVTVQHPGCVIDGGRRIIQLNPENDFVDEPMLYRLGHGYYKGEIKTRKTLPLTSSSWQHNNFAIIPFPENLKTFKVRRLTPTECARLQTIPGWYKWDVSETQQYKMLGNGWTVEVIKHILGFIQENEERNKQ